MGFTSSRNGAANAFSKLKNSTEPSGILHAVLVELAKLLAEPAIEQSQPTWSIAATRASMPALTFSAASLLAPGTSSAIRRSISAINSFGAPST